MSPVRRHLPVLLVLLLGLGCTWLAWRHEQEVSGRWLRALFDDQLRDTTARIVQRMNAYEQMLRGVQGFCSSSAQAQPAEFSSYVESLQLGADFAGIQGVGQLKLTPDHDKDRLIADLSTHGHPGYTIKPAGERPLYAPVTQIEPFAGHNIAALGFDPYSDPVRRAAMEAARDAGRPRITGKLHSVLEKPSEAGPSFILYAPLFRHGSNPRSMAERRSALTGWIYAPVHLDELMASLYGDTDPDILIRIHDGVQARPENLLYSSHTSSPSQPLLQASEYLEIGGRNWLIEAATLPGFETRFSRSEANTIAASGICLSLLLAVLARILATARQLALKLAERMTEDLRNSEERWKYALEGAGDGVWDRDLLADTAFYSRRCLEIFGYAPNEIAPRRHEWTERLHPEDREAALNATASCINGQQEYFAVEYRLRCKDGGWKWVLSRGRVMSRSWDGKAQRLIGTVTDIDARKATEEQIRHMAQHDPLTGLPNRALFADRLQQALSLARRDHTHLALFFVDLDEFKAVNDRFGHAAGDLLLQEAARRMQACVRESDTVGRIGGDELIVLLPVLGGLDDARHVAEKIRAAMALPFDLDGHSVRISASIGIASFPEHGESESQLWSIADSAMYAAKAMGGNRVHAGNKAAAPDKV
jgi:diguanylate cyclase (GGDEF)-like protein/PAS domain S-box-containing protein